MDLANRWIDMVLFYSEAFDRSWEKFITILGKGIIILLREIAPRK